MRITRDAEAFCESVGNSLKRFVIDAHRQQHRVVFGRVGMDRSTVASVWFLRVAGRLSAYESAREHVPVNGTVLESELSGNLACSRLLHRSDERFDPLANVVGEDGSGSQGHSILHRLTWMRILWTSSVRVRFGSAVM